MSKRTWIWGLASVAAPVLILLFIPAFFPPLQVVHPVLGGALGVSIWALLCFARGKQKFSRGAAIIATTVVMAGAGKVQWGHTGLLPQLPDWIGAIVLGVLWFVITAVVLWPRNQGARTARVRRPRGGGGQPTTPRPSPQATATGTQTREDISATFDFQGGDGRSSTFSLSDYHDTEEARVAIKAQEADNNRKLADSAELTAHRSTAEFLRQLEDDGELPQGTVARYVREKMGVEVPETGPSTVDARSTELREPPGPEFSK